MYELELESLNREFAEKSPEEIVKFIVARLGKKKIALASSMSIEDQVLTDVFLKIEPEARVFFIDTGRQ